MTQLWLFAPLKFNQVRCIVTYFELFRNIHYMSVKTRNTNFTLNLTKFLTFVSVYCPVGMLGFDRFHSPWNMNWMNGTKQIFCVSAVLLIP